MAAKKKKAESKKQSEERKHIPLKILEKRYEDLGKKIKARGGDTLGPSRNIFEK